MSRVFHLDHQIAHVVPIVKGPHQFAELLPVAQGADRAFDAGDPLAVAADKGVTVAVDAVITPELEAEGRVRDLVRYVQTLRKDADYDLDQRITVGLFGLDAAAAEAVQGLRDYILQETLCVRLLLADDGNVWDQRQSFKLSGREVTVAVRK